MASDGSLTGNDVRQASFRKPPLGKRGYNPQEVDEFMRRVADTLDGFGSLTANEVHNVIFGKPRIGDRGYDEEEVDAMLDIVASILRRRPGGEAKQPNTRNTEPLSGYQVRQATFPNARIGTPGYSRQQVDEFMARAADTLDGSGVPLTMDQVRGVRFERTKGLHRGYQFAEVDAMFARIVAELDRRSAGW